MHVHSHFSIIYSVFIVHFIAFEQASIADDVKEVRAAFSTGLCYIGWFSRRDTRISHHLAS